MTRSLFLLALAFCAALLSPVAAQSADPDAPTVLISGSFSSTVSTGNLNDSKTTYYSFEVDKGVLAITLDVTPLNPSDAGALISWTLFDSKFQPLRFENLAAQGSSPQRQVKELPVTIKRRIIMKVTAAGNADYVFKVGGTAVKLQQ